MFYRFMTYARECSLLQVRFDALDHVVRYDVGDVSVNAEGLAAWSGHGDRKQGFET
jgi:hypothetical protein